MGLISAETFTGDAFVRDPGFKVAVTAPENAGHTAHA